MFKHNPSMPDGEICKCPWSHDDGTTCGAPVQTPGVGTPVNPFVIPPGMVIPVPAGPGTFVMVPAGPMGGHVADDEARRMIAYREHVRQSKWDARYLDMVTLVGSWSKDPSTKVGAVITRPDNTVASIGFNGFPKGMSDDDELYADREIKYSRIVHGEINAILNAYERVKGYTLYVPMLPCDRCAVQVVQAGITRVVCNEATADMKSRWQASFDKTRAIFKDAGMAVVEYALVPEDR